MLILGLGKVKYNKKFYKAIIYTTLVMNIISFSYFPRSQSKYKDDNISKYNYSVSLYSDKVLYEREELISINMEESDITLYKDDTYIPDSHNAYFEYQITHPTINLDYNKIKDNISFTTSDSKDECAILKHQSSSTNKGIVWCKSSNNFETRGVVLNVSVQSYKEDPVLTDTEKIIYNVDVTGTREFSSTEYKEFIPKKNPLKLILDSKDDCQSFKTWLEEYDTYYQTRASNAYKSATNIEVSPSSFTSILPIKRYLSTLNIDLDSNTCSLEGLDNKILGMDIIENTSDTGIKSYTYTIQDNFVGYAKTYDPNNTEKKMYFSTNNEEGFIKETDNTTWDNIFNTYLNSFYSINDARDIYNYIKEKGGILPILKTTNGSNITGLINNFKLGSIELKPTFLDNVYNSIHKNEGRLRVTILGNTEANKSNMYTIFKENLPIVFGDVIDEYTLISLTSEKTNSLNLSKRDDIENAIISFNSNDVYIERLINYDYQQNSNGEYTRGFNVHIYSSTDSNGISYNWFEILPLGRYLSNNRILHQFDWIPLYDETNKLEEYLTRINQLDRYYGVKNRVPISENDEIYEKEILDSSGNKIGTTIIQWITNNGYKTIQYIYYDMKSNETTSTETESTMSSNCTSPLEGNTMVENSDLTITPIENNTYNFYSPKDSPSEYARQIRKEKQDDTEDKKSETSVTDETSTDSKDITTDKEISEDKSEEDDKKEVVKSDETENLESDNEKNNLDSDKDTEKGTLNHDDSDNSDVDSGNEAPSISDANDVEDDLPDLTDNDTSGDVENIIDPPDLE